MTQINLEGLRKDFGGVIAVDDATVIIPSGSFTVLLGPSGCGKTTTLNMIAGLETVTAGRILFDAEEVQDIPPQHRDIGMVFQSYALYPNRTVRQNIGFPLRMGRIRKQERIDRVQQVAIALGLDELLDRYPRALSGGQQQRVALARAIVRVPKVFLLDEPLSNLDAKLRADMRFELKTLQRELGSTFVFVTHDQAEALSMADLIVVMRDGRIQQIGAPEDIYNRPVNLFVAQFVGIPAMNLIEGTVRGALFHSGDWHLRLEEPCPQGALTLGIRSEDIAVHLATSGAGESSDGLRGAVRLVELVGSDRLVEIETDFGRLIARVPSSSRITAEDRVVLELDKRRLHLFDGDSDERRNHGLERPLKDVVDSTGPDPFAAHA